VSKKEKPQKKLSVAELNRLKESAKAEFHERVMTVADMLQHAFLWDKTPEGHDYWASVYENLVNLAHPHGLN
jgi:hypothetical protein